MKRILIIDNNIDPPYGCQEIVNCLQTGLKDLGQAHIFSRRGPDGVLPDSSEGIDGVVISGSKTRIADTAPWIEKQVAFIQELYRLRVPTLGICYGEQMIAKSLVGNEAVGEAKTYEYGWVQMRKLKAASESVLLRDLPEEFFTFSFHQDEVSWLPEDRFRITAKSAACAIQAFDVLDAPMWGVQYHPERALEEGNAGLDRLVQRDPGRVIIGRQLGQQVFDALVAEKIFRAFLSQIWLGV